MGMLKMNMKKVILLVVWIASMAIPSHGQQLKRRASLGFMPVPVDSTLSREMGWDSPKGLVVTEISEGGTFEGLKAKNQDILLEINGQPINSTPELLEVRAELREGDAITIKLWRDGKEKTLRGKAARLPYETSDFSEVIYGQFNYKEGRIRTIVNRPKKPGKHPAIFFIPGYTCTSIDNLHPLNPYRKLIDGFVEKGYVVFRMEKPGVGDNEDTGDCRQLGFDQELASYYKGYEQLLTYDFVDQENIFLWGHSMGGLYAPLIAAEKQPKGMAFYGMVHDSWPEYLLRMVRYQNPRIGTSDYVQTDADVRLLYELLYKHYYLGETSKELAQNPEYERILRRDFWFDGEDQILLRHENFWRELNAYSMTNALSEYKGYVLSMNGEADLEVLNDFSQREVVQITNHYHPGMGEFEYFPKTDHMMIEVGTLEEGAVIRYQPQYRELLATAFNHEIVERTHTWIQEKKNSALDNADQVGSGDWRTALDKSKINARFWEYDIIWKDEKSGSMKYHVTLPNEKVVVQDTSELEGVVWEKLDMVMDLNTLQMESGTIQLKYPKNEVSLNGQLNWEDQNIVGSYKVIQDGQEKSTPIDLKPGTTVLGRGAIFALIPALDISVGKSYDLDLFAFANGEVWNMELKVVGLETIEWKNEQVETYKLTLTGGKVDNTIFMATDGTGRLLRIDVVGQDMELLLR
ncbi:MAG: hypothetical protein Tsb004_27950 [Allomuricauda sp.]